MTRPQVRVLLALLFASAIVEQSAFADPIITLADRVVSGNGVAGQAADEYVIETFLAGSFDVADSRFFYDPSVPVAYSGFSSSQQTQLSPLLMGGSGRASATMSAPTHILVTASALSLFQANFILDGTYQYDLQGHLAADWGSSGVDAVASASLCDVDTTTCYVRESTLFGPDLPFASTGTLGPGAYSLLVSATTGLPVVSHSYAVATGSFDATLILTPVSVPEPGCLSLLLLGTGLFALCRSGEPRKTA